MPGGNLSLRSGCRCVRSHQVKRGWLWERTCRKQKSKTAKKRPKSLPLIRGRDRGVYNFEVRCDPGSRKNHFKLGAAARGAFTSRKRRGLYLIPKSLIFPWAAPARDRTKRLQAGSGRAGISCDRRTRQFTHWEKWFIPEVLEDVHADQVVSSSWARVRGVAWGGPDRQVYTT